MTTPKCTVSTMTMTTQFPNCELCLINVGKYLCIDNEIIGIKYSYANFSVLKGSYSTSSYNKAKNKKDSQINRRLFYNQISIVVCVNDHIVNVKLFSNGSIHMTGLRDLHECELVAKLVYSKLDKLRDATARVLLTKDSYSVLTDADNLVYSYNGFNVIGWKSNNNYHIHKKDTSIDPKTKMFMTRKEQQNRKRFILNMDGEIIGHTAIQLINNRSKYYRKNTQTVQCDGMIDLVYFNKGTLVGSIEYICDVDRITDTSQHDEVFEIDYSCCPFVDPEYTYKAPEVNVHCINVHFNLGFTIDPRHLCEYLYTKEYFCKYKPENYTGIKLVYKLPFDWSPEKPNPDNFVCKCNLSCLCSNVTFLIFQTGKVLATGFKDTAHIDEIVAHFYKTVELCRDKTHGCGTH
ncbi:hypothetical protein EB118_03570 [bacterium]|nr:hypothetical protein [bacterium]NDD82745.1 hypothetical protein [bacterium]NDG29165.1 hypothetical protein [bacterium]